MSDPNTSAELFHQIIQIRQAKEKPALRPQPIDADEAAAQCLALITNPDCAVLPAEAFRELTKRNAALLEAPKGEIQAALSRQAVLLEATATRFMSKAAITTNIHHASALTKVSLSASRSLVSVLGALHALAKDEDMKAVDGSVS